MLWSIANFLVPLVILVITEPGPPLLIDQLKSPATPPATTTIASTSNRVYLRINRVTNDMGVIAYEDDHIITIENRAGVVVSFPKSRILQIMRLTDPQSGQQGVVYLRNGQMRKGLIIEDHFDFVLVEINGIRARISREEVDHITLEPTFQEKYTNYKAAIQPGFSARHLELCRWLIAENRYVLAAKELKELREYANLDEINTMLQLVEAQIDLIDQAASHSQQHTAEKEGNNRFKRFEQFLTPETVLTNEDVNLIRVYEIDFRHPPKIYISPETIRKLIEQYAASKLIPESHTERMALFHAEPIEIARLMFELHATELYSGIQVITEPRALNLFRRRVHDTWLMNNCTTSRCHGGPNGGRLFLHRRGYKDDRVRAENLLILERLEVDPVWSLINYDDPARSLIIQYGLPRDTARKPHPKVKGWKPIFSPRNTRMLDGTIEWIESMMHTPRPWYPIEFEPPTPPGAGSSDDEKNAETGLQKTQDDESARHPR